MDAVPLRKHEDVDSVLAMRPLCPPASVRTARMELRPGELEGALPARATFALDEEWEHLDAPMFYDLEAFGDAAHCRHVSSAFAENAANTQGASLCSDPHAPGAIVRR